MVQGKKKFLLSFCHCFVAQSAVAQYAINMQM